MPAPRHCPHCWGNCAGECLVDATGLCIHGRGNWLTRRARLRLWWRRLIGT
jgi:hypothetical protein